MLDVAPTELLLVAAVAVIVIGPKDLPKAMRVAGYWVGRARGVARQFRQGFDDMVREAEFKEMEKKWAEDNARIMREFPPEPPPPALPAPADGDAPPPHAADAAGPGAPERSYGDHGATTPPPVVRDDGVVLAAPGSAEGEGATAEDSRAATPADGTVPSAPADGGAVMRPVPERPAS